MGRGASAAMIYMDEIEHTPFFDELLSNSAPAFKTAADNARETGRPAGRLMSCTPLCKKISKSFDEFIRLEKSNSYENIFLNLEITGEAV
jgi:hypothetical protein